VEEALPFGDDSRSDPRAELAKNVAHGTKLGGMTGEVPAILSDGNETLPFLDVSQLNIDDDIRDTLTIEQYASLCAELTSNPTRRQHTFERYGIDEESLAKLREAWDQHFTTSPKDKQRFDELFMRYRTWLSENR
jgi:hypothetical protein